MTRTELLRRFPELGTDEPLSGADVVDRLSAWYNELTNDDGEADFGFVPSPALADAWERYQAGQAVSQYELRRLDEERALYYERKEYEDD